MTDAADSLHSLRDRLKVLEKGRKTLVVSADEVKALVDRVDNLEEENEILREITGAKKS